MKRIRHTWASVCVLALTALIAQPPPAKGRYAGRVRMIHGTVYHRPPPGGANRAPQRLDPVAHKYLPLFAGDELKTAPVAWIEIIPPSGVALTMRTHGQWRPVPPPPPARVRTREEAAHRTETHVLGRNLQSSVLIYYPVDKSAIRLSAFDRVLWSPGRAEGQARLAVKLGDQGVFSELVTVASGAFELSASHRNMLSRAMEHRGDSAGPLVVSISNDREVYGASRATLLSAEAAMALKSGLRAAEGAAADAVFKRLDRAVVYHRYGLLYECAREYAAAAALPEGRRSLPLVERARDWQRFIGDLSAAERLDLRLQSIANEN